LPIVYAVVILGLTVWVIIWTRRGPPPDESHYALIGYVAVPFGLPWSLLFAGWWINSGLVINAVVLYGLGWLIDGARRLS